MTVLAASAVLLIACDAPPQEAPTTAAPIGVLDYRQPYAFDSTSKFNRLLIEVQSRMRVIQDGQIRRYVMLSPHPRELTFDGKTTPYREMLANSGGGSEITFVHALDDDASMISRRFEHPDAVPRKLLHECPRANYSALKTPRELLSDEVRPLTSLAQLMAAAQSRQPIVGRLEYRYGTQATIALDFPIRLVNIKPELPSKRPGAGSAWQAVSAPVPLPIGDPAQLCDYTRPAVFAFRDFSGLHAAVRLCEQTRNGLTSQDFSCPVEVFGNLQLFALINREGVVAPTR